MPSDSEIEALVDEFIQELADALSVTMPASYAYGDLKAQKETGLPYQFNVVKAEAVEFTNAYMALLVGKGASVIQGEEIPWLAQYARQTRQDVFDAIKFSFTDGMAPGTRHVIKKGTLAAELRTIMSDGRKDWEFIRIARTELARANFEGSFSRYEKAGVTELLWRTGAKPCDVCAPLGGQVFPIHKLPYRIPVHPHCGCTVSPVIRTMVEPRIPSTLF